MQFGLAGDDVTLSLQSGSLTERLAALLQAIPDTAEEQPYALGDLSLLLGLRLPDLAQTETYWHRGETGRAIRGLGFGVRVEFGHVIFVRRPAR
jgi:hypothetical protein